jgi:hypothetical protein
MTPQQARLMLWFALVVLRLFGCMGKPGSMSKGLYREIDALKNDLYDAVWPRGTRPGSFDS